MSYGHKRAFVLRRWEDGRYVAQQGSKLSYTRKLDKAEVYFTRESAEAHRSENETIVAISLASDTP